MGALMLAGGWRYGARLWDLKRKGFNHEIKRDRSGCYYYRRAK
jgi:hypothetical protein